MKVNYNASDKSTLGMAAADDNFKLLREGICNCPKPISEIQSVYCRNAKTGIHGLMCADCFGQVTVLIVDSPQESCNARFQTPDGRSVAPGRNFIMAALPAHSAMACYRSISSSVSSLQAHHFDVVRNVREILQPLT